MASGWMRARAARKNTTAVTKLGCRETQNPRARPGWWREEVQEQEQEQESRTREKTKPFIPQHVERKKISLQILNVLNTLETSLLG